MSHKTPNKREGITIGQEIMRSNHGTPKSMEIKQKFADLFDELTEEVLKAEARANKGPFIDSHDAVSAHMIVVAAANETTRCLAEACKYLELASLFAVKGVTA